MAGKKIKLEAIGEILVADTDSKSGSEASDFDYFQEEEEEDQHHHHHHHRQQQQQQQQQQASTEIETQAATSGGLPTWGPPQGRNTNIHPFVGPAKGVKESEAPHINKDSSPLSVFMLFFTEIFHLLVEQTNVYYQQHLGRQAGPTRRLPDITLLDMMTFIALGRVYTFALRMCIEDDSSSVNVNDESWSIYTFQWSNSFHLFSECRLLK